MSLAWLDKYEPVPARPEGWQFVHAALDATVSLITSAVHRSGDDENLARKARLDVPQALAMAPENGVKLATGTVSAISFLPIASAIVYSAPRILWPPLRSPPSQ